MRKYGLFLALSAGIALTLCAQQQSIRSGGITGMEAEGDTGVRMSVPLVIPEFGPTNNIPLSFTTNTVIYWQPGGEAFVEPWATTLTNNMLQASNRMNIKLPASAGLIWVTKDGHVDTCLYNSDPNGLQCDSDFHVYGTLQARQGIIQINRYQTDLPDRRNWEITSEFNDFGDLMIAVSPTNAHSQSTIPVLQFLKDKSARFYGTISGGDVTVSNKLQTLGVSQLRHYAEFYAPTTALAGYLGYGGGMFSGGAANDFGIRADGKLLLGNSLTPTVSLDATSGLWLKTALARSVGIGAAATLGATNDIYLVNQAGQAVTLPTAVGARGRCYTVKAITPADGATIATTSSQLIDGAASYSLSASNKFVTVTSDNANWWIIGNN